MKSRFCVLCILGMLLLCVVSCGGVHLEADLAVCGVYSVPGMFCADLKGGSVSSNIIDEDLEGRILFDYSTFNIITGKKESAFVICQFRDGDYVYFYEDVCYCLEKNAQQAIESFMTENDWGQPLDFNKMSRRKVKVTIDLFINTETQLEYKKVKEYSSKALKTDSSRIVECSFVDCDSAGHELYYLTSYDFPQAYLVLLDGQYNVSIIKVSDKELNIEEFAQFKRDNGWGYGFEHRS